MKRRILIVTALALLPCLSQIVGSTTSRPQDPLLGIPPQEHKYYSSSDLLECKDGSKTFTKAQLNDDFCDCPDGTDEPGTSACPSGKFYCRNAGHAPLVIFSSRVNDGICDCCDGSDEYDGKVNCPNMCWEAGKVARDKLKRKIATYQEGVKLRKYQVEQAKLALEKDDQELSKLKREEKTFEGLAKKLKVRIEQIEKEEEKERLRKEKEEKEKSEAGEKADQEKTEIAEDHLDTIEAGEQSGGEVKASESTDDDIVGVLDDSPTDQDNADSENTETMSREELGRMVASRWTGEYPDKQSREADASKDIGPKDTRHEENDGYVSEADDDAQRFDDGDIEDEIGEDFRETDHDDSASAYKYDSNVELQLSDDTTTSDLSWLKKIQQAVQNFFHAVNPFQAPVNLSDAVHIRKEYDDASAKLSKMKSRISSLTQKLKHDFGPEKEFYSFYGSCFESKQNKYVYKVCPYKQASQEEGYTTTGLGQWDKYEDSYKTMIFSNGDRCWNGPVRSLKVKLRCGLKNEVADVDEPSRCEYVALLSTPAVCREEELKELQDKLEMMNKEQPQGHDEL